MGPRGSRDLLNLAHHSNPLCLPTMAFLSFLIIVPPCALRKMHDQSSQICSMEGAPSAQPHQVETQLTPPATKLAPQARKTSKWPEGRGRSLSFRKLNYRPSIPFRSIPLPSFLSFHSFPFHPPPFCPILFHSLPFSIILFPSLPFPSLYQLF